MVPPAARTFQGSSAGIATRVAANAVDALVVSTSLVGGYGGYLVLRIVISPRAFRAPNLSLAWLPAAFLAAAILYLTVAWWLAGRTVGERFAGVRVLTRTGHPLRFPSALARAVLCAVFPVGLVWCVVDTRRRSVQDLALRTKVVYDWLPRHHEATVPLPPDRPPGTRSTTS